MWLIKEVSKRAPDLVIGPKDDPYMERWYLRKAGVADLYVHKISRSDDSRALHDHRSDNISIVLQGSYREIIAPAVHGLVQLPGEDHGKFKTWYDVEYPKTYTRGPGSIVYRKAEQPHRLEVTSGEPVWTLWFKFKDRRDWGFWPKLREVYGDGFERETYQWVQWQQYEDRYGARV